MANGITITVSLLTILFLVGTLLSFYIRIRFSKVKDTPTLMIEDIYEIISPIESDTIIDLGSGDFRVPFYFATKGIRSHGVEISPLHVLSAKTRRYLSYPKLKNCKIILSDMHGEELSNYSIIYLNHSEEILSMIKDELVKHEGERRVFSFGRKIPNLTPKKNYKLEGNGSIYEYKI